VQAWLGHTNISQTSTFLAVTDTGADEAMAKFDRLRAAGTQPSGEASEADAPETLQSSCEGDSKNGGPRWNRTSDPLVKSQVLYP
jgi:hypothetical protein